MLSELLTARFLIFLLKSLPGNQTLYNTMELSSQLMPQLLCHSPFVISGATLCQYGRLITQSVHTQPEQSLLSVHVQCAFIPYREMEHLKPMPTVAPFSLLLGSSSYLKCHLLWCNESLKRMFPLLCFVAVQLRLSWPSPPHMHMLVQRPSESTSPYHPGT